MSTVKKAVLAVIGIGLLFCSNYLTDNSGMLKNDPAKKNKILICGSYALMNCAGCFTTDLIEISFPKNILISDSDIIKVIWTPDGPGYGFIGFVTPDGPQKKILEPKKLPGTKKLTLSSAAFDVKPSEALEREFNREIGTATWTWSISAKKEGSQELLLHFNDLKIKTKGAHTAFIIRNDGAPEFIDEPELESAIIPIEVLTAEGISLKMFLFIKYSIALIGFILLYPAVSILLTKLITKKNSEET